MKDLTQLAKEIHQTRGYIPKNDNLFKIELLTEAFHALRAHEERVGTPLTELAKEFPITAYSDVEDTLEQNIACVAYEALNLVGHLGKEFHVWQDETYTREKDFNLHLAQLLERVQMNISTKLYHLRSILQWCFNVAEVFEFDLLDHIQIELIFRKATKVLCNE